MFFFSMEPQLPTNPGRCATEREAATEISLRVQQDKKYYASVPALLSWQDRYRWEAKYPRLQALLIDVCSFLWRMGIRRRLREALRRPALNFGWLISPGPTWELDASGHLVRCKRTGACIQDTENFLSTYPKATMLEEWVFVQAWKLGAESALRSFDTPKKDA